MRPSSEVSPSLESLREIAFLTETALLGSRQGQAKGGKARARRKALGLTKKQYGKSRREEDTTDEEVTASSSSLSSSDSEEPIYSSSNNEGSLEDEGMPGDETRFNSPGEENFQSRVDEFPRPTFIGQRVASPVNFGAAAPAAIAIASRPDFLLSLCDDPRYQRAVKKLKEEVGRGRQVRMCVFNRCTSNSRNRAGNHVGQV